MDSTEPLQLSLRYTLSLAEAEEGFRLATRQPHSRTQFLIQWLVQWLCAVIIAWGIWLGVTGDGVYFVILGVLFFVSQWTLRYGVMPWLFRRQYRQQQVNQMTQGFDLSAHSLVLYSQYPQQPAEQRRVERSALKQCKQSQLCYLLVLEDNVRCIVPRRVLVDSNATQQFEQIFQNELR